jgi:Cu(I)/Ag(I) efflux system protein CusF
MKKLIVATMLACTGLAMAAPEWVRGVVVKVDSEKGRVTLKHERIQSIGMEAMIMPFTVTDKAMLTPLKPGDKVWFTVTTANDHLAINAMEPVK